MSMSDFNLHLLLVACQYPGGMLDRSPLIAAPGAAPQALRIAGGAPGPADLALHALAQYREQHPTVDHLLALGDQIYVDATAGFFDPRSQDGAHQALLNARWESPFCRRAFHGVQWTALMDDHEVLDNWEPSLDPARQARLHAEMTFAKEMFTKLQAEERSPLWHTLTLRGTPIFIGDTRTERSARSPLTLASACIVGDAQAAAMKTFLSDAKKDEVPFKFVATSSVVLPRRLSTRDAAGNGYDGSIESDAWDGYPASLHALLRYIVDHRIDNVVFLSGDEHIGMVASITLRDNAWAPGVHLRAWSIHAGALYAPYPFANARAEDFADTDEFMFACGGGSATCTVETWFPGAGDGFYSVSVRTESGTPRLSVEAHRTDGSAPAHWPG